MSRCTCQKCQGVGCRVNVTHPSATVTDGAETELGWRRLASVLTFYTEPGQWLGKLEPQTVLNKALDDESAQETVSASLALFGLSQEAGGPLQKRSLQALVRGVLVGGHQRIECQERGRPGSETPKPGDTTKTPSRANS